MALQQLFDCYQNCQVNRRKPYLLFYFAEKLWAYSNGWISCSFIYHSAFACLYSGLLHLENRRLDSYLHIIWDYAVCVFVLQQKVRKLLAPNVRQFHKKIKVIY